MAMTRRSAVLTTLAGVSPRSGGMLGPVTATTGGQLLLILASTDAQTVAQLTGASGLSPSETHRQLTRLVEQGFIVAGRPAGAVALYRLNPKGVRTEPLPPSSASCCSKRTSPWGS
jgi:IclR helix-turn-helix domain